MFRFKNWLRAWLPASSSNKKGRKKSGLSAARVRVELLEDRVTPATSPTFVNDNWNLVTDNGATGVIDQGDILNNANDTTNPGGVVVTYGVDGFGTVTTGTATGSDPNFDTINDAIAGTTAGGTVNVLEGTYTEQVVVNTMVTLQGAQAGVDARGRSATESIITGGAVTLVEFQTGSAGSTLDGFTLSGGNRSIQSTSGPLDNLQLLNNIVTGFTGSGIFLNDPGTDITVDQNVIDGTSKTGAGDLVHLDTDNFNGFHLTNNDIVNNNPANTATGFFVDGNHNVGPSGTRNPLISGNLIQGNQTGMNLGTRAFGSFTVADAGTISNNTFSNNIFDGLQGGMQHVLITRNIFSNNGRSGLALTSFGNTGADRGAQNTQITENFFGGNGATQNGEDVFFSATQAAGTISTNTLFNNSLTSTFGVTYNGTETINASGNWWGTASNPEVAGRIRGTGAGNIDYTPWLNSGTDTDAGTPGFQGDFSVLNVDDDSAQFGPTGRIQEGVNLVNTNGTINVLVGTYNELVNVNKTVTLQGAQAGVDPRSFPMGRPGGESVIDGFNQGGAIQITADNVVVNGFTIQGVNDIGGTGLNAGIWTNPGFSGTQGGHTIVFNIIQNNVTGVQLANTGTLQAVVQNNLFQNNNNPGPGSGDGIRGDFSLDNALIDNNTFLNHTERAVLIFGASNTTFSNNEIDGRGFGVGGGSNLTFTDNVITGGGATGISLTSITGAVDITGNTITGKTTGGVRVLGSGTGTVNLADNILTGNAEALRIEDYTTATLSDLTLTGNTAGGAIADVVVVNFTGTTGTVADVITASGSGLQHTRDPLGANVVNDSVALSNVTTLNLFGGDGADTFNVTPPASGGTFISVDGGDPTSAPGDVLNFDAQGAGVNDDGDTLIASGFQPVDYTNIETINLLNVGGLVVDGTTNPDTLRLFVDPVLGPSYQLNSGPVTSLGSATSFAFNGADGADTMTVDLSNGDPIPAGNVFFNGGNPTAGSGDSLQVIGNGTDVGFYNPSATTPGDGNTQIVGKGAVVFTGLEPTTVSAMAVYTFVSPNSTDVLTIDSPAPGRNRVSGTSDGVAFEALTFFDVTTFILDTGANDGALPEDLVTLDAGGLVATGLQNFVVATGAGNDAFAVNATSYSAPVSGGGIQFQGGAGSDTFFGTADIDYTLTDGGVGSSAGGTVSFGSIEFADLTGGAGDNTFTVSGWTKTAALHGGGQATAVGDRVVSVRDEDYALSNTTLIRNAATFLLDSIEGADLTGGASINTFTVAGWTGDASLDGLDGGDSYDISFAATGVVDIADTGTTGTDAAVLTGTGAGETYTVTPTQTDNGAFVVTYDGNVEQVTLNAGAGADAVTLTPSADTEFFINGEAPTTPPGDSLDLDLTGVTNIVLATGAPGEGQWTFGNRRSVTYTGIETVGPVVTIAANDPAAAEAAAPAAANPGQFTVTRTGSTAAALTVNYTIAGTATNGADYAALSGSVVIGTGQASAVIDVNVINDALTEGNETVVLTLATGAYAIGAANSDTVTIADNEPEVSIVANDSAAAETVAPAAANPGQFTVTRTGDTTAALTVNYTIAGTATNGADYTALSGTVVIPAGQSSAPVNVSVINDPGTELPETVVLTLAAGAYTVVNPTSAFVVIADNEPEVSIAANDPSAAEDPPANPGQFTVTRTGDTTAALTVNYTIGGTATNGADYTTLSGSVTIGAGQASAVINVAPLDDALTEGSETVVLTLAAGSYTVAAPTSATVTISASDPPPPVVTPPAITLSSAVGGPSGGFVAYNSDGSVRFAKTAYPGYASSVRVAVGDVNHDGTLDVITGTGAQAAHVKVFDGATGAEIRSFFAFTGFAGGVNVGAGDVDGDGFADVLVATATQAAHVKAFSGQSGAEVRSFFAFTDYAAGLSVAGADLDGDHFADIVVGTAAQAAHVKAFSGLNGAMIRSFLGPAGVAGINVGAGDLDGDALAEIVVAAARGTDLVRAYTGNGTQVAGLSPFGGFPGGVTVAVSDRNLDGDREILVGAGPGAGPHVKAFSFPELAEVASFFAFDPAFTGGVSVA